MGCLYLYFLADRASTPPPTPIWYRTSGSRSIAIVGPQWMNVGVPERRLHVFDSSQTGSTCCIAGFHGSPTPRRTAAGRCNLSCELDDSFAKAVGQLQCRYKRWAPSDLSLPRYLETDRLTRHPGGFDVLRRSPSCPSVDQPAQIPISTGVCVLHPIMKLLADAES